MKELLYAFPAGMDTTGADWGLIPAHMAYRVLSGPRLAGAGLTDRVRGGAMYLAAPDGDLSGDPRPFCRQVAAECGKRGFSRVICDFENIPSGGSERLLPELAGTCARNGLVLYLPEALAPLAPGCRVLISSVVTSGTLEGRLEQAAARYGRERLVLAVEAAAEDFLLPASGRGEAMTRAQLQALMDRLEPAVFFDRGLCAHYFTYMVRAGCAHFVLFDTPRSIREKLAAAQRLRIPSALLAAPEVEPWLCDIFGGED